MYKSLKFFSQFLNIQIFSLLTPLFALLIIQKNLELDQLSKFLFILTTGGLLGSFIEYGFNLTGIRLVTQNNDDKKSELIGAVHILKLILTALSLPAIIIICMASPVINGTVGYSTICIFITAIAIGFRPFWFFHGREDLGRFQKTELASNFLSLLGLYLISFITNKSEVMIIAYSTPKLLITFYNLKLLNYIHPIKIENIKYVKFIAKGSYVIFLHKIFALSVHQLTTIILGVRLQPLDLLAFQQAEKIFTPVNNLINTVTMAFLPKILKNSEKGVHNNKFKLLNYQLLAAIFSSLILYYSGDYIMNLLWRSPSYESIKNYNLLILFLPIMSLNISLGMGYLFPAGRDRTILIATAVGGVSAVLISSFTPMPLGSTIGVYSIYAGEVIMTVIMMVVVYRNRVKV